MDPQIILQEVLEVISAGPQLEVALNRMYPFGRQPNQNPDFEIVNFVRHVPYPDEVIYFLNCVLMRDYA